MKKPSSAIFRAFYALLLPVLLLAWQPQAAVARPLSAAELKQLRGVYQATWKGRKARVEVRRDGTLLARSGTKVDIGRWQVRGNELCVSFRVWTRGKFKCGKVERQGRWLVGLRKKDGTPRLKLRR